MLNERRRSSRRPASPTRTALGVTTALAAVVLARWIPSVTEVSTSEQVEELTAERGAEPLSHEAELAAREDLLARRESELERAKRDFMMTVAHELRTPLTNIAGFLAMVLEPETGPLNPEQQHMLDVINRNAQRLSALVDDLMVLTQVEVGSLDANHREVDYGWLVNTAVAAAQPMAEAAGVTIQTDVVGSVTGRADPDQIDKLLAHLLTNAVKFSMRGDRVGLAVRQVDDRVMITATDGGIGIPKVDQARVFERFFRASNAVDRAVPGVGLGLAILAAIVEQHHGQVSVDSTVGLGTTVTVSLPVEC